MSSGHEIGLLERENATLLNACLAGLADRTTTAFEDALVAAGIDAPLYLTQNDGTEARRYVNQPSGICS